MLKKTIKFTDFEGVEQKKDFYFNLTKAELMEMELEVEGGMAEYMNRIAKANNMPELIKTFKKIILDSYGEKGVDGSFTKSEQRKQNFSHTEAYSELFMELCTNSDAAAEFVNGIMPKDMAPNTANHPALSQ